MLCTGQQRHLLLGGPRSVHPPYPTLPQPSSHCTGGPLRLSIRFREHYSTLAFDTEIFHPPHPARRLRLLSPCSLPRVSPAAARDCLSARANGPRTKSDTPARVGCLVLHWTDWAQRSSTLTLPGVSGLLLPDEFVMRAPARPARPPSPRSTAESPSNGLALGSPAFPRAQRQADRRGACVRRCLEPGWRVG